MQEERRIGCRQRVYLGAEVTEPDQRRLECTIRNLSAHGARLETFDGDVLGDDFILSIRKDGRRFRTHVVWRQGQMIGVDFIDIRRAKDSMNDNVRRRLTVRDLRAIPTKV